MTPDECITALDQWSTEGGNSFAVSNTHRISTAREAEAVCRALQSKHILDVDEFEGARLEQVAGFFQDPETEEAAVALREKGLPVLREILGQALEAPAAANGGSDAEIEAAHLLLVKILAAYQEPVDATLIVKAVRKPLLPEKLLWWSIFSLIQKEHPKAVEICEALAQPLPTGFLGVMCLELANSLAITGRLRRHPFDNAAGIAQLSVYLEPNDHCEASEAVAAAVSIPFLAPAAAGALLAKAVEHPDWHVRIEAAWASAKGGSEEGRTRLAAFCHDARYLTTAVAYLEELGLQGHIPAPARDPDLLALAEMSDWLAYPTELGRVPDEIELYDRRELFWPPVGDNRTLWLVKYRCHPTGVHPAVEGVGLVGSTTFVLFDDTNASMPPEDIYGIHCCYELVWADALDAPEERTAAEGRKLIAEHNPGFA